MTNDKGFEQEVSRIIDDLILRGLVEIQSIDPETGEFLYRVSETLLNMMPEFQEDAEKMFVEQLDSLWVKGFVAMDKTLTNPIVSLTEIAFDEEKISDLSFEERVTLETVKNALRINEE